MTEFEGTPRAPASGRVALVASRFNETVTTELVAGARECLAAHGVPDARIDVVWVPGAFELPLAAAAAAASGRYAAIVALGCVIRGETPHFEYVASEAARGLGAVARERRVAIGFGVLTTDTVEQAMARAGGPSGNKGYEAAEAALRMADVLGRVSGAAGRD